MLKKLLTKFLVLFGLIQGLQAQQTVKGTILDEKGSPIIAVNVILKGTGTGTVSDMDGKYSISVPNAEAVLEFSFIGYKNKSEKVGTRTTIDVILEEDAELLDEVVVSALGFAQKKRPDGFYLFYRIHTGRGSFRGNGPNQWSCWKSRRC